MGRRLEPPLERLARIVGIVIEDLRVETPAQLRAAFLGIGRLGFGRQRLAALEPLREVLPLAPDVQL